MKNLSKKTYIIIFFLAKILLSSAQNSFTSQEIDFTNEKPSFVSVLGGNILCQPVKTSYGYIAAGDGKQILGFSKLGKLLWQRAAPGRLKPFITEGPADLIYGATTDSTLFMMNSSGLVLWTQKSDFNIEEAPLCGKDGRIFIRGTNGISCYGLKGVKRWQIGTEAQNISIPLATLNDGTILVFLSRTHDGKSIAKRISPFGTEKEEIIFAGQVLQAVSCKEGVALAFSDGSIGLCSVNENGSYSKWTFLKKDSGAAKLSEFSGKLAAIYKNSVYYLNEKTGGKISEFQNGVQNFFYSEHTSQGLVICGAHNGACYKEDGTISWKAKFSPQKKWNFVFASDSGYLVFCMSNWALEAFQTRLNFSKSKDSFIEKKVSPYSYKYSGIKSDDFSGRAINENLEAQMKEKFSQGNFGAEEENWNSLIQSELDFLYDDWTKTENLFYNEKPYFKRNIDYCQKLIELESESGIYFGKISSLLKKTSDPSLLICLVRAAGKSSFDPQGELLSSIEIILKTKTNKNDKKLLQEIADSTYEICRFMGRPSFFRKGQEILKYMLYPQFDKETKDYALKTLDKIIEAQL